jgi:hypothetical protein
MSYMTTPKCTHSQLSHKYVALNRAGDRMLVEAKFSTPVRTDPGAHPASYTTGPASFSGLRGRSGSLTTHPI